MIYHPKMKHYYIKSFLLIIFILLGIFSSFSQQTVSTTVYFSGFQACGGCTVCGDDYWCTNTPGSYCGDTEPCRSISFFDPVPPGNVISNVVVNYWTGSCEGAAIYGTLANNSTDIFTLPVAYDGNTGCLCSDLPCVLTTSVSASFPCGINGYNYGGINYFTVCSNAPMCINRAELIFSYVDISVMTPTITASGPTFFCGGGTVTLTANSGYISYNWSTGDNTQSITVSPTSTTTYTVSVTTTTGCTTANASLTVTVVPYPTITATATSPTICVGQCTDLNASGGTTYGWAPGNLTGATVNVCPTSTTVYSVLGENSGCTGTTNVTVNVFPNPVTTATASPTIICTGQSSTLTASGASTYTWQPGDMTGSSVTVSPTTTTIYTVTGANDICTSQATVTITVDPTPAITVTPSAPSICYGQSVDLTVNSSVPLTNCTWNPTTGLNPPNSCNPTANPTTTTTYFVQGQSGAGCSNTTSVTVTVNPLPLVSVSSDAPNNTICSGQCTQLSATSTPADTGWLWAPGNGLSSTTISNPVACPTATTTYTVGAQTAAGCTGTNSITITVNPTSTLIVSPDPANICAGNSVQMDITGIPPLSNCTWSPTTGLTPPNGSCSPTASPASTTTYTITGENAYNCTSSTSVTITVHPNPVITITPEADTICYGESTTLQASDNPSGLVTTWTWDPQSYLNPANSSTTIANPPSTVTYTLTGTSDAGCTDSESINVVVDPLPVLTFDILPNLCITSTPFLLTQALPSGGYYSGPGIFNDTLFPSMAGVGTHTITYYYTDQLTGCSNTITQTITIDAGITVLVNPSSVTICPENNAMLTASGATTYVWSPFLGLSSSTEPIVIAHPPTSQIYTVVGSDPNGCSGAATATVNYYNTNIVNIFAEPPWGCNPVHITGSYVPEWLIRDSSWVWNFGDYYSNSDVYHEKNPTHFYQHEGNYVISFHAQDTNGCAVIDTEYVEVFITPQADFYSIPDVAYTDNPQVQFIDLSLGANYWFWNFDDYASYEYNFSDQQNPFHIFSDSGTYLVQLIVTSSHNCSDTVEKPIRINQETTIFIPNAFTPNNDLLNDVFKPSIIGIDNASYKFYIFDRWGRQQFFTDNVEKGWNGKYDDKECETGVYVYLILYKSYTGKDFKLKGTVTLVR